MRGFWILLLGWSLASVTAQVPTLDKLSSFGLLPGRTNRLTFFGSNLREVRRVWTSFPASVNVLPDGDAGKVRVECVTALDAPLGVGAVRVLTDKGLSNPLLVVIDDLPTVMSGDTNTTEATAQPLTFPVAVEGRVDALKGRFFRFSGKRGQRVAVEVLAQRLGTSLDPVIRLIDRQGRDLAYSDDEPGLGHDSRFSQKLPDDGEYRIEVRDILYEGGSNYRFRLRLGDFPEVSVPLPMVVRAGTNTSVTVLGRSAAQLAPVTVTAPAGVHGVSFGVRLPEGKSSAFVVAGVAGAADQVEVEMNDLPERATQIMVPGGVSGRFLQQQDKDWYEFELKKAAKLVFVPETRVLGSPSEAYLELYDGSGKPLSDGKIAPGNEGAITNSFKEAGRYRLLVRDLIGLGGPQEAYRVAIEPYARIELNPEKDVLNVAAGDTISLKLKVGRRGIGEPLQIAVAGLPAGAQLAGNLVEEKKDGATLKITLPPDAPVGSILSLQFSVTKEEHPVPLHVSTEAIWKEAFPEQKFAPLPLEGTVLLAILPAKPAAAKPAGQ